MDEIGASPAQDRSNLSDELHAGLESRDADQARTLDAVHVLEAALAEPAPGREVQWRQQVLAALSELDQVMAEEYANAERPESLLSDIRRTQPRLRTRVRGVRSQFLQIRQRISDLREELEQHGLDEETDFADLRTRIGWLLTALRHQRARESDLLYEAYYDAFGNPLA